MPRDAAYVAVYDVSEDRERDRVAKVLEGFGMRVQYSAFELRLTPATRQTLLRRLAALELKSGFLYLYRRAGHRDRTAVGEAPADPLDESRHAFVITHGRSMGSNGASSRAEHRGRKRQAARPVGSAKTSVEGREPRPLFNPVISVPLGGQLGKNEGKAPVGERSSK